MRKMPRQPDAPIKVVRVDPRAVKREGPPFIKVPCAACEHGSILRHGEFRCSFGHHMPVDAVDFECPREGCQRTAKLDLYPGVRLKCGRHETEL